MRRPKVFRHAAVLGVAMLLAPGLATVAPAQHTPDPYNIVGEYNQGYEDYLYPSYPTGGGFNSNQAILQGSRSAQSRPNTFQSYLDGLDGGGGSNALFGSGRGRGGIGEPYYRAHRQFDDVFQRIYTPNEEPDKTFYQDQEARTRKYMEYLKEGDPKKRAQLYREYNQASVRAARDFGSGSARAASRNGTSTRSAAAGSVLPTPSASSRTNPFPATTRSSQMRRPSASATGRTRGAAPAGDPSETAQQILDRAGLMDRANRATVPAGASSRSPSLLSPAPR